MTPLELALALAIAKVAANEAAFDAPADLALIHQSTLSHGSTVGQRLDWLRQHSPCVLGDVDPATRPGNCAWSRNLRWSSEEPEGWPANGLPWSHFVDRWRSMRKFAAALVTGAIHRRPCPGRVWTWGGALDIRGALARGLVPLQCEGTLNLGFALPRNGGAS